MFDWSFPHAKYFSDLDFWILWHGKASSRAMDPATVQNTQRFPFEYDITRDNTFFG